MKRFYWFMERRRRVRTHCLASATWFGVAGRIGADLTVKASDASGACNPETWRNGLLDQSGPARHSEKMPISETNKKTNKQTNKQKDVKRRKTGAKMGWEG